MNEIGFNLKPKNKNLQNEQKSNDSSKNNNKSSWLMMDRKKDLYHNLKKQNLQGKIKRKMDFYHVEKKMRIH